MTPNNAARGQRHQAIGISILASLATLSAAGIVHAQTEPPANIKAESFDRDPQWEGVNNRFVLEHIPTVRQDFGYSATHHAGKTAGEMGGSITRTSRPAYYADAIAARTLDDKLSASGTFAITRSTSGSGVFFGWFNADQPGASGRPIGSLGLDLDGEGKGGRLAVRLITRTNQSAGTFITRYEPYRSEQEKAEKRPTPIRNDGTRYTWKLDYDPDFNQGNGRFQFSITSNQDDKQDWEGKIFSVDLPPGYRKAGATFDRFGVMNMMKAGGTMDIHFDDLAYDGRTEDFTDEPKWVGSGNRESFEDRVRGGVHDFGFSAATNFAGGSAGEAGGDFWRAGEFASYADRVGPLSLDDRLEASGKVMMRVGGVDADMYLGWFSSDGSGRSPVEAGNFAGVHVGGPTRIGHMFQPVVTTGEASRARVEKAPVLQPGKTYAWSAVYDPEGNDGNGEMRVTLGEETVTLALKPGLKKQRAKFDRFGLFTSPIGGQLVRLFVDDLKYSAMRQ